MEAEMGKINWGRVLLGGIVAGVVINIFEYVTNGRVLAADWASAMQALGHSMPPNAVPYFVLWGFLVGIGTVWLYAAVRPRFGSGPGTAILAGFAMWLIGYVFPNLVWLALALVPSRLTVITSLVGFVEIIVATLIGGWIYQEKRAPAV
jgi:hypothetical protein